MITLVKKYGGLKYAEQLMNNYHNEAINILTPFEDNDAKESLKLLLDYVVNRKK